MAERSWLHRRGRPDPQAVVVIGLGRFGTALAETLAGLGHDVLGVDESPSRVAALRDTLSHVVEADSTDPVALAQMGVADFDRAVVAIGGEVEASILTTAALVDLGIKDIWAKAMTAAHARILDRVGAHHVVFPEAQMGERIAHLVAGRMLDYLPIDAGFALVETVAPPSLLGRSLGELGIRSRHRVTVVCVKPAGGQFTYATPDTVLHEGDVVVVAGETSSARAFAALE
ncbi:MAG: potassium channel family protein [Acidimicrobiales bacterium]